VISAKIIADSASSNGDRITTMQLVYPRFIHSEFMTHRVFSRNASSSRAIPVFKIIQAIRETPALPVSWGKNQKGMQANEDVDYDTRCRAEAVWLNGANEAINTAQALVDLGVHKQIANRVLEPYAHITVIVTATDWDNFFELRRHKDAQPEIHELADRMFEAMEESKPTVLTEDGPGSWHAPYINMGDWAKIGAWGRVQFASQPTQCEADYGDLQAMTEHHVLLVSAARCARVSYLNHDGTSPDLEKDIALANSLSESGHWSPFEHQACACSRDCGSYHANFKGFWSQRLLTQIHQRYADQKALVNEMVGKVISAAHLRGAPTGTMQ
jgi:thymidylate synthase ThyX